MYTIPKEGFSPSASYKLSKSQNIVKSSDSYCPHPVPALTDFPILESFYASTLERMPGLKRLNSLFTNI